MSRSHVSKVYATALLELAKDANSLEATEEELAAIIGSFFSDDTIRHYFLSPLVDPIQKENTAAKAVKGQTSEIVANFITLVIRKNRFLHLPDILEDFKEGVDAINNRSSLKIYSKETLSGQEKERITKAISTQFGRQLRVQEFIDPSLIGGFKLYIDDYSIDASIRHKLNGIEEALLQKKIPVGAIYEN
ncbi:ATP synthase F1 subunit delta [Leptospira idonii]|uniref:ATP synthase subunit delta n=1 Tax=Leptospira idonii TaxID=1193500 RepID=A0A4R9M4N4_9LEPT|nr:ATP synthase F1 subunit delta [Leptospira idonii]TGN20687.1 ATP synthase F1 subunit delta [Leptospira idonii]